MAMDDMPHSKTFSVMDEDHTFANSVRFALNQDPRVQFCGYSIPHPSENRVNIRIQTTAWVFRNYARLKNASCDCHENIRSCVTCAPASEVFRDGCQNLMTICQHVRGTFANAVEEFKRKQAMDEDSN